MKPARALWLATCSPWSCHCTHRRAGGSAGDAGRLHAALRQHRGNTAEMAIDKHLMQNLGFDPDSDFAPVVLIHNVPLGLIVSASSPYRSMQDLLDAARRDAGRVSFANSGSGSPAHFAVPRADRPTVRRGATAAARLLGEAYAPGREALLKISGR